MITANNEGRDAAVARIAREVLHIETLEVRNRDRLDFHELGVQSIREALLAAYEAGRERGRDAKRTR